MIFRLRNDGVSVTDCPTLHKCLLPRRTSDSSCWRCDSSSLFSFRMSLPSSWSSRPTIVTVKSITVTLAVAAVKKMHHEGPGRNTIPYAAHDPCSVSPAQPCMRPPDSSGVNLGLGRRVVQ